MKTFRLAKSHLAMTTVAFFMVASFGLVACQSWRKSTDHSPQGPRTAQQGEMYLFDTEAVNSDETLKKPYVILISIDGYRFDYNKVFAPPVLNQIAREGVAADSLRPSYPSKTFPNHYTLVTGLYPDHHGIVSNEFFDPARGEMYSLSDPKSAEDGTWYFGEPLWITAQKQGMLTASFFWVGSEADIQGMHPNYYFRYSDKVSTDARVDQALEWLKLPSSRRPHLITLYFDKVDSAAHKNGVASFEVREAVRDVDRAIGRLWVEARKLDLPVNFVIVSDHGMQNLDAKKVSYLDDLPWAGFILTKFRMVGRGPQILLYLNPGENPSLIDEAQKLLRRGAHGYRVFKREQMDKLNFSATPRVGDLIIEPDEPVSVGLHKSPPSLTGANHGWDPIKNKAMHGIFYAQGPQFQEKIKLATFDNIDVYPLLLEVLKLKQRVPIDGSIAPVRAALKPEAQVAGESH